MPNSRTQESIATIIRTAFARKEPVPEVATLEEVHRAVAKLQETLEEITYQ